MKHIGIVVDNDLNKDIRVMREIAVLRDLGYTLSALCFGYQGRTYEAIEGVEVVRIPISLAKKKKIFGLFHTLPFYKNLWKKEVAKFIRKVQPDVIHTHDLYMAKPVKLGIEASSKAVPLVLDLHENFPVTVQTYGSNKGFVRELVMKPRKWAKVEREYLNCADRIVFLSEDYKQNVLKEFPELQVKPSVAIPNVPRLTELELEESNCNISIPTDRPILLYFGVVANRRGIFEAIIAFKEALEKEAGCRLLIIGPVDKSDKEQFKESTAALAESGDLIYVPWIPLSDLAAYLAVSDVALAPFHKNEQHESGIANKIYQYMEGGLPIIASNCKPQMELIQREKCGLIFSNHAEFVEAIIELVKDKENRNEMGDNGKKALRDRYHFGLYEQVLASIYD